MWTAPGIDRRVARFGAAPRRELPFPAFLVASRDDPWCALRSATALARDWGCRFADAGAVGHINADSNLGDWVFGKLLLSRLTGQRLVPIGEQHRIERPAISPPAPILH